MAQPNSSCYSSGFLADTSQGGVKQTESSQLGKYICPSNYTHAAIPVTSASRACFDAGHTFDSLDIVKSSPETLTEFFF